MTRDEAIQLFWPKKPGEPHQDKAQAIKDLAAAMNKTRQSIYGWPDDLPQDVADRVMGAAIRCGRISCRKHKPKQQ